MKIFYHHDADGKCAGYLVAKYATPDEYKCEYYEMDYNTPIMFENIHPNETIYIVDFSISPDDMLKMFNITKNIIWIDHHQTAIKKYNGFPYKITGIRGNDDESGCLLTWKWFNQDKKIPLFVNLIDDWDTWKHKDILSEPFIIAFNSEDNNYPSNFDFWSSLEKYDNVKIMVNNGLQMIKYRSGYSKSVNKHIGSEICFEGLKIFASNIPHANSTYFSSIDKNKYDAFMPYYYDLNKRLWTYSLYSCKPEVDVGSICAKYGGGGHKNAAGFSSKELIL